MINIFEMFFIWICTIIKGNLNLWKYFLMSIKNFLFSHSVCTSRNPGKSVPGKMVPETWSPGKMVLGKMVPGKMVPEKNGRRKKGPREKWSSENWSPEKWSPENWSPGNSETKNFGAGVEHRGVCVECCDVINLWKPKTRQQTQNTETKNGGVSVEHRGVCVECSDVINLWKPKIRQQIFLGSFSVLQFGAYVGS